ncbi:transglycosylase domain-containing protein [Brevibacillus reuszeri]|uniref:transglycosylase domain-containing protein n=1 Tax=Brevibacillus reuszeri TaxID=54915 RepID=UPI00289CF7E5|nr:biosynthetic peptidoglycan transglycosylase [Brevibacillus reuszeri]
MNHFSIPVVGDAQTYIAAKENERAQKQGSVWKKRIGITLLTLLVCAMLAPILLGWAGNIWIDEKKLAALHDTKAAVYVKLDEMPDYMWKAFVAIEDHRFMQHGGVDPVALARALWIDVSEGGYVQGGSTITMQLARNLFLTQDKTMLRKVKEMAIAMQLEQRYSKKELLEMYLNVIYFGHGKYGIEEASAFYFNKSAKDSGNGAVTLGEAAILASLPKAPENYSPVKHWENAKQRQSIVLNRMAQLDVINQAQKQQALAEAIKVSKPVKPAS